VYKVKNKKILLKNIASILAWTATVGGFYLIFYPLDSNLTWQQKMEGVGVFVVLNLIFAYIMSLPKNNITLNTTKKVKTNIFFGNLFDSKTNIVIPVNEYFDILVDDKIITKSSLHGTFINTIFGSNVEKLNEIIKKQLIGINGIQNTNREKGNKIKYPIGTTILVEFNGKRYFLVALSCFDDYNKAYVSNKDYHQVIYLLLQSIHRFSQGEPVNIPLIGSGQSGVKLSKQEILEYLIFSIKMHDELTVSGGINIILYESSRDELDLNKIDFFSKYTI